MRQFATSTERKLASEQDHGYPGRSRSELIFDPLVDEANITVKNMNGEVALNGTVPSYPQYLEAAAAAHRVAGVKNVHNHLEVMLPPDDYLTTPC